jgi:hypothetical protein
VKVNSSLKKGTVGSPHLRQTYQLPPFDGDFVGRQAAEAHHGNSRINVGSCPGCFDAYEIGVDPQPGESFLPDLPEPAIRFHNVGRVQPVSGREKHILAKHAGPGIDGRSPGTSADHVNASPHGFSAVDTALTGSEDERRLVSRVPPYRLPR